VPLKRHVVHVQIYKDVVGVLLLYNVKRVLQQDHLLVTVLVHGILELQVVRTAHPFQIADNAKLGNLIVFGVWVLEITLLVANKLISLLVIQHHLVLVTFILTVLHVLMLVRIAVGV